MEIFPTLLNLNRDLFHRESGHGRNIAPIIRDSFEWKLNLLSCDGSDFGFSVMNHDQLQYPSPFVMRGVEFIILNFPEENTRHHINNTK
jgi:hypothetical protein